jgi:DNA-binding IclR family transcriptional regulator
MHGASVVVVHHVFRPDTTLQILEVGAELPLHASALGKAMLAFAPADVVDDLLGEPAPRLTSRTLNAGALRSELEEVREQGVASGSCAVPLRLGRWALPWPRQHAASRASSAPRAGRCRPRADAPPDRHLFERLRRR